MHPSLHWNKSCQCPHHPPIAYQITIFYSILFYPSAVADSFLPGGIWGFTNPVTYPNNRLVSGTPGTTAVPCIPPCRIDEAVLKSNPAVLAAPWQEKQFSLRIGITRFLNKFDSFCLFACDGHARDRNHKPVRIEHSFFVKYLLTKFPPIYYEPSLFKCSILNTWSFSYFAIVGFIRIGGLTDLTYFSYSGFLKFDLPVLFLNPCLFLRPKENACYSRKTPK